MATSKTGIDPLVTLLAIKAILLAPGFGHVERRLAAALIEHFNRKTGQCDPSLERLAELLGANVRTIQRAVEGLVRKGIIRLVRRGGRSNRNCYELIWPRLDQLEKEWRTKFEAAARRRRLPKSSSSTRHFGALAPDKNVSQTDSKNLLIQPYSRPGGREFPGAAHTVLSSEAARAAAHRRLDEQLKASSRSAAEYACAVNSIDDETWSAAVEAECRRRGAGARALFHYLQTRQGAEP